MPDERWEKLQRLFDEAMALPRDERAAFITHACGDDLGLRAEIDALILADDANLSTRDEQPFLHKVLDPEQQLVGTKIDDWRIVSRIGAGGMGSVYLAERVDDDFEQRAAIKIIRKGLDTESVLLRFRQERQILARLNHPNIAGFLDGGMTPDGRPYFAMEYVDGLPVTDYCDQHRLTVEQRLELFQEACAAVHHAHRNLVVHRDIKPSNIIVTADGDVKLLDFGIAKMLDTTDADERLTRTGMAVLTPAYATPEQLTNGVITTATDVYGLGVVLYELLTGRRPFEVRRTPGEMRELVLAGNPPKPSVAVTQQPVSTRRGSATRTRAELSAARGERTESLRKRLAGDLDTICLMAMHREPEHRYASADQMAADLERHLAGQPVVASPDSLAYRLGKFYRRNRAAIVSALGVVLVFALMVVFYTTRLAEERDRALEESRKANEVVDFVTGLFEVSDPSESRGRELTARDLLDLGADRVRTELAERPAIHSTMQRVLGEVYYSLGANDAAESLLQAALAEQRALYGDQSLDVARTKLSLGFVNQDRADFDAAGTLYREVVETRRALLGNDNREVMEALSASAFLAEGAGNFEEAEKLHAEALQLGRRIFDGDDEYLAEAMTKLAGVYQVLDRASEAEPLLREALAMQDRLYGGPHPKSDTTRHQIANLLRDTRRFDEAGALYLEVIESRTTILGPDHLEVAHTWNDYSQLLSDMDDQAGAVEANRTFIGILERAYAGPHPSLAAAYHNLATYLTAAGDLDGAIDNYRKSIDMQTEVGLPPRHPNRAFPMAGIANTYLRQERYADAEAMYRKILDLRRENYPEDHVLIAETRNALGAALTGLGRYEEAEVLLLDTYRVFLERRGAEDPRTERGVRRLVTLYEARGDEDKAAEYRALLQAAE